MIRTGFCLSQQNPVAEEIYPRHGKRIRYSVRYDCGQKQERTAALETRGTKLQLEARLQWND